LGLMSGAKQPVAARRTLHNLPQTAIYGWEPYAQFGAYLPDTFWYGN
jgi:peptide/nickel transport system substrate-binding protein